VEVAVLGADAQIAAAEGIDELIAVSGPQAFSGDFYRTAVGALVAERRPSVVLAGFTVSSMSWAAALAAKEGYGFASDVVSLSCDNGSIVARREFYGAKVQGELTFPGAETVLLLLRPTVWQAAAAGGAPPVTSLAVPPAEDRERHLEYVPPPTGDVDITTADVILAIGRGVGEKDNVAQYEQLADNLGVTLAASRPLIDAGWVPAERQVGQSGKTVKPRLYVAFGISGAVQHLAGMKGATTIVAVNADPEAAIFNVANYGAVVDMFEVADELEALT
jgi:electron transfer flavoprotein alpha subunit